jgi:hypothetical protein
MTNEQPYVRTADELRDDFQPLSDTDIINLKLRYGSEASMLTEIINQYRKEQVDNQKIRKLTDQELTLRSKQNKTDNKRKSKVTLRQSIEALDNEDDKVHQASTSTGLFLQQHCIERVQDTIEWWDVIRTKSERNDLNNRILNRAITRKNRQSEIMNNNVTTSTISTEVATVNSIFNNEISVMSQNTGESNETTQLLTLFQRLIIQAQSATWDSLPRIKILNDIPYWVLKEIRNDSALSNLMWNAIHKEIKYREHCMEFKNIEEWSTKQLQCTIENNPNHSRKSDIQNEIINRQWRIRIPRVALASTQNLKAFMKVIQDQWYERNRSKIAEIETETTNRVNHLYLLENVPYHFITGLMSINVAIKTNKYIEMNSIKKIDLKRKAITDELSARRKDGRVRRQTQKALDLRAIREERMRLKDNKDKMRRAQNDQHMRTLKYTNTTNQIDSNSQTEDKMEIISNAGTTPKTTTSQYNFSTSRKKVRSDRRNRRKKYTYAEQEIVVEGLKDHDWLVSRHYIDPDSKQLYEIVNVFYDKTIGRFMSTAIPINESNNLSINEEVQRRMINTHDTRLGTRQLVEQIGHGQSNSKDHRWPQTNDEWRVYQWQK